jgi:hypothetical protein
MRAIELLQEDRLQQQALEGTLHQFLLTSAQP